MGREVTLNQRVPGSSPGAPTIAGISNHARNCGLFYATCDSNDDQEVLPFEYRKRSGTHHCATAKSSCRSLFGLSGRGRAAVGAALDQKALANCLEQPPGALGELRLK
jgi:hypothetical protein